MLGSNPSVESGDLEYKAIQFVWPFLYTLVHLWDKIEEGKAHQKIYVVIHFLFFNQYAFSLKRLIGSSENRVGELIVDFRKKIKGN